MDKWKWYTEIEKLDEIKVSNIKSFSIPIYIINNTAFNLNNHSDIARWLSKEVIPFLDNKDYIVQNVSFMKDLVYNDYIVNKDNIADKLTKLNNYLDLFSIKNKELVLREIIPFDKKETACIYGGLPLRTIIRVAYDTDRKMVSSINNYWNYDEVYPHLYNRTDKIVFKHEKAKINKELSYSIKKVGEMVETAMRVVKLTGHWYLDILIDTFTNQGKQTYWLIDMSKTKDAKKPIKPKFVDEFGLWESTPIPANTTTAITLQCSCGSEDFYIQRKKLGNNISRNVHVHIGLYCSDCDGWIKWISKSDYPIYSGLYPERIVSDNSLEELNMTLAEFV